MDGITGNGQNGQKWLNMSEKGWKLLERAEMAYMASNYWKWLELTENG